VAGEGKGGEFKILQQENEGGGPRRVEAIIMTKGGGIKKRTTIIREHNRSHQVKRSKTKLVEEGLRKDGI